MANLRSLIRLGIVLLGLSIVTVIGVGLFWAVPAFTPLGLGNVLAIVLVVLLGFVISARVSRRIVPTYNVAEVEVAGPITRSDTPGPLPVGRRVAAAEAIVEQIERADADANARALIVKLNTPGGEVVPSEDIRTAVAEFDGPTVAYAEDSATSGGYWIATGADEIHARRGALVGSIGVNGAQLGREDLRDKLGLAYRRFVAGEYKDTPSPWRSLSDDEVAYFQGILDDFYAQFVDTVVAGTDLAAEDVEETEARVYQGETAVEIGLADRCGPRQKMEDRLADRLGVSAVSVKAFEPKRRPTERLQRGVCATAEAFGAGVARSVVGEEEPAVRV